MYGNVSVHVLRYPHNLTRKKKAKMVPPITITTRTTHNIDLPKHVADRVWYIAMPCLLQPTGIDRFEEQTLLRACLPFECSFTWRIFHPPPTPYRHPRCTRTKECHRENTWKKGSSRSCGQLGIVWNKKCKIAVCYPRKIRGFHGHRVSRL
jgi:hypothetical protein